MRIQDLNYITEVLNLLIEAELEMAEFYKTCKEVYVVPEDFWEELVKAELRHGKNIEKMKEIVNIKHELFTLNRPIKKEGVNTFIKYIEEQKNRVIRGELDELKLLYIARDIEQSIIENKFYEIVSTNDVEFNNLTRFVLQDTNYHKERITQRIKILEGLHKE